ncbi:hypothetical protein COLO4_16095 [Corchorus olitorius]|uniref:Uncharacterized protein n=1 Tax=Corchorus olitorius TaxID=93759 RepID=A0A1R3JJM7_9ROSI|nr:hypothetical protein COLO4_16095 [Corchorus olitorius]
MGWGLAQLGVLVRVAEGKGVLIADVAKWDGLEACLGQSKVDNPT